MKWACIAFLLVLAAVPRFRSARASYDAPAFSNGDEEQYWLRGQYLSRRDGSYSLLLGSPGAEAFRASLYPAFIALVGGLCPPLTAGKVRVAQAALNCALVLLVFWLGCAVHSPLAGLAGACLAATNPVQTAYCSSLNIHSFFSFIVLLVACCLARWAAQPCARTAGWLGLSIGVSLACRSTLIALPALPLIAMAAGGGEARRKARSAAVLIIACAVPLLPWTLRNAWSLGEFVPLERGVAANSVLLGAMGAVTTQGGVREAMTLVETASPALKGADGAAYNREMWRLAFERIRRYPGSYLVACCRRVGALLWCYSWWFPPALLLAMVVGVLGNWRKPGVGALILLLAYFLAIYCPLVISERYMIETIPLACLLAGCGIALLAERAGVIIGKAPHAWRWLLSRAIPFRPAPAAAGLLAAGIWGASVFFLAGDLYGAAHTESIGSAGTDVCRRIDVRALRSFERGRTEEALSDLTEAIQADPFCAEARQDRGVVLATLGRDAQALHDYDAAVKIIGSDPSQRPLLAGILSSRASSRVKLGQTTLARADLAKSQAASGQGGR